MRLLLWLPTFGLSLLLAHGCSSSLNEYRCTENTQCIDDEGQGVCHSSGYCAFVDFDECNGYRFGRLSGELSGLCVEVDGELDGGPREIDAAIAAVDATVIDASVADAQPGFARYININGPAHTGVDFPGNWEADDGNGDICNGSDYFVGGDMSGTVDDQLFRGSVYTSGGNSILSCTVPNVPDGTRTVTLLFGENYFGPSCAGGGGVGSRVFDIKIEGAVIESDVDIYSEGGCVANEPAATPITRTYEVAVTGGSLEIALGTVGNAIISAIAID